MAGVRHLESGASKAAFTITPETYISSQRRKGFACQPRMPLFSPCYLLHWKGPVTTGKTMQSLHIPTTLNPVAYWKTFHIHEYDTEPFPLKPHADCSSNLWCAILSQWAPENKKLVWEWGFRNERVPPFISTCQLETPSSIFINTQPTAVWGCCLGFAHFTFILVAYKLQQTKAVPKTCWSNHTVELNLWTGGIHMNDINVPTAVIFSTWTSKGMLL